MAKKLFSAPFLILSGWGGGGEDEGGGSGGYTDDPSAWDYNEWLEVMVGGDDNDGDGDIDKGDYILWARSAGISADTIEALNPGWDSYDPAYYKAN